jgi:hypothetical protein
MRLEGPITKCRWRYLRFRRVLTLGKRQRSRISGYGLQNTNTLVFSSSVPTDQL